MTIAVLSLLLLTQFFQARTKHIEVDYHFIREHVLSKDLVIRFISSYEQLGNIFTKALFSPRFLHLRSKLQLHHLLLSLSGRISNQFVNITYSYYVFIVV